MEEDESGPAKQVGKLIGVDPDVLIDNFVQPKIKVRVIYIIISIKDPDVLIDNFVQPMIKVRVIHVI